MDQIIACIIKHCRCCCCNNPPTKAFNNNRPTITINCACFESVVDDRDGQRDSSEQDEEKSSESDGDLLQYKT